MANDDDLPTGSDDLPQALPPEGGTPAKGRRRSPKAHSRVLLDDWEASELAKAVEPHVRRIPDADGNLPRRPSDGTSELLGLTVAELHEKLAPDLPFQISMHNVEGVVTRFYGKPVKPPRVRADARTHMGDDEHVARIEKLEESLARTMVHLNELASSIRRIDGTLKGQQEIVNALTKGVGKHAAEISRLDSEKVSKVGTPLLEAARRNTLARPGSVPGSGDTQAVEVTHDLTKLGEIMARRTGRPVPGKVRRLGPTREE